MKRQAKDAEKEKWGADTHKEEFSNEYAEHDTSHVRQMELAACVCAHTPKNLRILRQSYENRAKIESILELRGLYAVELPSITSSDIIFDSFGLRKVKVAEMEDDKKWMKEMDQHGATADK